MIGWIDQPAIVPFLKYIIEGKAEKEFRDIIVDRMITRTKQKDGTCFDTFRRINIDARKSFNIT